jgi:hypothetical protein
MATIMPFFVGYASDSGLALNSGNDLELLHGLKIMSKSLISRDLIAM